MTSSHNNGILVRFRSEASRLGLTHNGRIIMAQHWARDLARSNSALTTTQRQAWRVLTLYARLNASTSR